MSDQSFTCEVCGKSTSHALNIQSAYLSASQRYLPAALDDLLHSTSEWACSSVSNCFICQPCYTLVAEIDFHQYHMEQKMKTLKEKHDEKLAVDGLPSCLRCGGTESADAVIGEAYELKPYRYTRCRLCRVHLPDAAAAEAHFRALHPNQSSHTFVCFFCFAGFATYSQISTHVLLNHLKDERERGESDLISTPRRDFHVDSSGLIGDLENEVPCRSLSTCRICSFVFRDYSALSSHMQLKHYGAGAYVCSACGMSNFAGLKEFRDHLRTEGVQLLKENFFAEASLWDGLDCWSEPERDAEPENVFETGLGSQLTRVPPDSSPESPRDEFLNELDIPAAAVREPSYAEVDAGGKAEIETRISCDTENSTVVCVYCVAEIPAGSLLRHYKVQHGFSKASRCANCHKIFRHKKELNLHRRKEHLAGAEKEVRFFCEHCGKKVKRKRELLAHLLSQHGIEPEGKPVYRCEVCAKSFLRQSKLDEHRRAHDTSRIHQCLVCSRSISTSSNLRLHMRRKHPSHPL